MVQELGGAPRTRVGQEVTAPRMRGRAVSPPAVTACAGGGDRCGPDRARPAPRRRHRSRLPKATAPTKAATEGQLAQPSVALKYSSREPQLYIRGEGAKYIYERPDLYNSPL